MLVLGSLFETNLRSILVQILITFWYRSRPRTGKKTSKMSFGALSKKRSKFGTIFFQILSPIWAPKRGLKLIPHAHFWHSWNHSAARTAPEAVQSASGTPCYTIFMRFLYYFGILWVPKCCKKLGTDQHLKLHLI